MKAHARRIAIIGGGIAGVTAAWQLAQLDRTLDVALFESSSRMGGTVETVRRDGFVIECGPDGWVTEKPWAHELAQDLGLGPSGQDQMIPSNDATRVTYIVVNNKLQAMPDGMRMMVPTSLDALDKSPLFSSSAKSAYAQEIGRAAELLRTSPAQDESIADFVLRHFGSEILQSVAAPLLSGVFGGNVERLSVRAIMPAFVRMEQEHGSLIKALRVRLAAASAGTEPPATFTTLRSGAEYLVAAMTAAIPFSWLRYSTHVTSLRRTSVGWTLSCSAGTPELPYDNVLLAVPANIASSLLTPSIPSAAHLLHMEQSSAVIAALAFRKEFPLPRGFGFLVPRGESSALLACTFVDQKFPGRVPAGCRLIRAFFGSEDEDVQQTRFDEEVAALALRELRKLLGPLPEPAFHVVRRWPCSLPQYAVGHLERMTELDALVRNMPGLCLLGNAYRGVGLPDLIRDARAAARRLVESEFESGDSAIR